MQANSSFVPDGYGGVAGQFVVSYRTANSTTPFATADAHMRFWNGGYGDLNNADWPSANGFLGEITLTPINGPQIILNGFDLAGFPAGSGTLSESVISILHDSTSLDFSPFNVTRSTHDHFSPAITSSGPISIRFGTDWNIGIDNIDLTVVPVPEAPTYISAIFLLAVAVFRLFDWKKRKQQMGAASLSERKISNSCP